MIKEARMIKTKKAYKQGGTAVITVGKENEGKMIAFTTDLTEDDLRFMLQLKNLLKR